MGNQQVNYILDIIHEVLENLVWTYSLQEDYTDKYDTWKEKLTDTGFELHYMHNKINLKKLTN